MSLNLLTIALENAENSPHIALLAEVLLRHLASFLKVILEGIAILIIVHAVLLTLQKLLRRKTAAGNRQDVQLAIRLELGLSLGLSLEFLLAADIVGTAVSPTWEAIGKLAAITGIRTFLNFFLQKEVTELEKQSHPVQEWAGKGLQSEE